MILWTKKDLEEMCGDDVIDQLAFLAGCFKHKLINDEVTPDGWIIPDESLRKFAELIVKQCASMCECEGYRLSTDDTTENHRDLAKQCHKIGLILTEYFGVE